MLLILLFVLQRAINQRRNSEEIDKLKLADLKGVSKADKDGQSCSLLVDSAPCDVMQSCIHDLTRARCFWSLHAGAPPATWWIVGAYVVFNHAVALYTLLCVSAPWQLYVATVITYWFTGFGACESASSPFSFICSHSLWSLSPGITAGYHRLWSHRAYSASLPLRVRLD